MPLAHAEQHGSGPDAPNATALSRIPSTGTLTGIASGRAPLGRSGVAALQRAAGNAAVSRLLQRRAVGAGTGADRPDHGPGTGATTTAIQSVPTQVSTSQPSVERAAAPSVSGPLDDTIDCRPLVAQRVGLLDKLTDTLDTQHRFRLGDYNLYSASKSKDFPWSKQAPGESASSGLTLGVIPLPLPVGPVMVEATAGVSAFVRGAAAIDVTLKDVTVVLTTGDLLELGADAFVLSKPWVPIPVKLAILAKQKFHGTATLSARANASLEAGANATLGALLNPKLWPVAGFVDGFVGAYGSIRAEAGFTGVTNWTAGPTGLRMAPGQSYAAHAGVAVTPEIGLTAGMTAGMLVGYRPASIKYALWSHTVSAGARKRLQAGIQGGQVAMLNTSGDGPPTVDLEPILLQGKAIIEALFATRDAANDTVNPNAPADVPGVPAQGIGDIQTHGQKPPSNRNGAKILWTESEHVIPYATGKRLWEVIGLVVPGRGGHQDRGQTTIMIYYEAARLKTPTDNEISSTFEAAVQRANAVSRMERARILIDAGHPEQAMPEVRAVLGAMARGLEAARADAVARTTADVTTESAMHMDGHQLTNGQRRGPQGSPEPPTPDGTKIATAAQQQYDDIFRLAQEDVEAANQLR